MKRKIKGLLSLLCVLVLLFCSCTHSNPVATDSGVGDDPSSATTETAINTETQSEADSLELTGAVVYDGGDNSLCHVVTDVEKSFYDSYLSALESNSYELYTENKYGQNCFSTYVNNETVVNVVYTAYNKTLRVISEPLKSTALPAKTQPKYTKKCELLAIAVGLAPDTETNHKNGMCYIFRLEDGSFVIYDGGWDHSTNKMSDKIYSVLKKNVPDGMNIVISAWVITHAHTDHIGGFNTFIRTYRSEVEVRTILLNTPSDSFCKQFDMDDKVSYLNSTLKMCTKADIIKAHPGQKLMLAGAQLEVLYTLDLYDSKTLDEYNTSSVVTRLTVGNQTFMMTGDMTETSNTTLCEMYGSKLRSDFVQVAHHGYEGGTTTFYNLVKADYVLWPSSKVGYDEMKNKDRNSNFKVLGEKRLIVSLDNISIITLPYSGTGVSRTSCSEYLNP